MKDKECNGCKGHFNPFFDEDARTCILPTKFRHNNKTYKCPCVLCLVKVTCNKECSLSYTYNKEYSKRLKYY